MISVGTVEKTIVVWLEKADCFQIVEGLMGGRGITFT
jgi:hypothetical protein